MLRVVDPLVLEHGMTANFVVWPIPHSHFTFSHLIDAPFKIYDFNGHCGSEKNMYKYTDCIPACATLTERSNVNRSLST